jgi:elongation factor Ts
MATITPQMVKELRQATGAGVLDCKQALELHDGDVTKSAAYLREKGMVAAEKRADREAREGLIGSYIHAGSKVAGLVELNCETDFVAHTDQFQDLAHDLAMQVVAAKPTYLSRENVPAEVLDQQRADYRAEVQHSGKPEHVIEQIVEGKINKFVEDNCLLEQPFIKDPSITISELVKQTNAQLGENLVIRRFVRFEVGG